MDALENSKVDELTFKGRGMSTWSRKMGSVFWIIGSNRTVFESHITNRHPHPPMRHVGLNCDSTPHILSND